jgi:hypothetical protein
MRRATARPLAIGIFIMHASIAFCLMMVGGPIAPEPEIIDVPLIESRSNPTAMDDLEWKERSTRYRNLPHVPTLGEDQPGGYDRGMGGMGRGAPGNPYAPQRRAPTDIPSSPTDPGSLGGGGPMGPMPAVPGRGGSQGYGGGGQGYAAPQGYTSSGPAAYTPPPTFAKPVNGNYGGYGAQTYAPTVTRTPTASDTMNGINYIGNMTGLGLPTNPMLNNSVGTQKDFSGYQPPTGYSPWMSLYTTPTNNGTVSTYSSTVQPQIQQQTYNRQVAEQIQGVRNYMVAPPSGTGGQEQNMGQGNGLANPNAFLNYGPYYPQMGR